MCNDCFLGKGRCVVSPFKDITFFLPAVPGEDEYLPLSEILSFSACCDRGRCVTSSVRDINFFLPAMSWKDV